MKKVNPLDLLTISRNHVKIIWPKPHDPPPPMDFQLLCIYDTSKINSKEDKRENFQINQKWLTYDSFIRIETKG
jgi:hypothetical protein